MQVLAREKNLCIFIMNILGLQERMTFLRYNKVCLSGPMIFINGALEGFLGILAKYLKGYGILL